MSRWPVDADQGLLFVVSQRRAAEAELIAGKLSGHGASSRSVPQIDRAATAAKLGRRRPGRALKARGIMSNPVI